MNFFAAAIEESDNNGTTLEEEQESEESRQWKRNEEPKVLLKPKYGVPEEALENVWGKDDGGQPPHENP